MTTSYQSDFIQIRDLFTELDSLTNYVRFQDNIIDGCNMATRDAYSLWIPDPFLFGIRICSSNRNHTAYLWRSNPCKDVKGVEKTS